MTGINEKYVKQVYETMCNNSANMELIATQIAQMPIREQNRFFRLLLTYIDITADKTKLKYPPVGLIDTIELSKKLIDLVNDHYYEKQEEQA